MMNPLSSTTLRVLEILNDCAIHAGSDIAKTLGISRTAVWKIIQRLKNYQVDIESQHQGYRLKSPLILFDQKKMERLLKDSSLSLEIFESLPSTNDYLKNKSPFQNKEVCLSEYQSEGRGRLGRSWTSPFGCNIYCSFSRIFAKDICELSGLSLVGGLLTLKALEELYPELSLTLKWPNDIYHNHQKMGGILIDLIAEAHGNCKAIISMGLNINMKDVDVNLDQPWTSLEHALGKKVDRNGVAAHLIETIVKGIVLFEEKGMESFLPQWERHDFLKDKQVSLAMGSQVFTGVARGISPQGYLQLELEEGRVEKFSCGDTTLRFT